MSPTVRPATAKDFTAVARLLTSAFTLAGIPQIETAADVKARSNAALVIVAEFHGAVVGTMTVASAGTPYGPLASKGQMEVSRLAVEPLFQGRGIGAALVQAVVQSCRNQGVQALVGVTLDALPTAHRLYESAGAKPTRIPGLKARGYTLDLSNEKDSK
ncbi:GNAT family N-acetyltransferase [Pseudarthrobacter sp. MDT3-1]